MFTALGSQFLMTGLNDPAASLTLLIFDFGSAPYENAHRFAWGAALILLLIVLSFNVALRLATRRKFSIAE